jgi:hypothetical protein
MTGKLTAIVLGVSLVAAGCAVKGAPFERATVQQESSVVYVYRPYAYGSSLLRPAVTCGDESARIGPGGYHAFVLPNGKVTCTVETSEEGDQVELDPDPRVHYLEEDFGWGWLTGHPHLNPVDNDKAQAEIQKCVLEDATGNQANAPTGLASLLKNPGQVIQANTTSQASPQSAPPPPSQPSPNAPQAEHY